MNIRDLIILTVYALQTDSIDQPTTKVLNLFNEEAEAYNKTPKQFGDMVLRDALSDIREFGPECYGNYTKSIESLT